MRLALAAAIAGLVLAIAAFFYGRGVGADLADARCRAAAAAEAARQAAVNEAETERQRQAAADLVAAERARQVAREDFLHAPPAGPARACLDPDRVRRLDAIR
jgi:hypothetical protein